MAINWDNLFTTTRSLGITIMSVAGGIAAAPAGTFDPKVTAAAQAVAAVGAGVTGLAHLGKEAVNPATFPQTAIMAAQAVAPAVSPQAQEAVAVAPVAVAAIQAIQQVHADAVAKP
jgi:hypothetical protein